MKLRSRHGCLNCKLRKRKCDEKKPMCGHCSRLGYQCEWLNDASTVKRYKAAVQKQQQRRNMPIGLISEREHAQSVEGIPGLKIANREDLRISFLLYKTFTGANSAIQSGAAGASLTVYTELQFAADETSLTYGCVNAMAMIYWGAVHNDPSTLSAGYNARGRNLVELRKALTENTADISGDLVAAVALMRLADTLMPNAKSQWMIHAKALTHLFRAVGPRGFTTPRMRRLVENNRWVLIMAASVLRQPTLLSKEEWKIIPWQNAEKDMLQTLLDVYARIPTLHALFDEAFLLARDGGAIEPSKKDKFDTELNTILFEMQQWRQSVDSKLLQSARPWNCQGTMIIPLYPDRVAISFEKLHHAYAVVLFNMMTIVLSLYISKTSGLTYAAPNENTAPKKSRETILEPFAIPFANPLQRAAAAADEIAQIIPWTMKDSHKGAGALYMAAPAVVCDQFWRPFNMDKSLWFGAALSQVGGLWESLLLLNPSRANDLIKVLV